MKEIGMRFNPRSRLRRHSASVVALTVGALVLMACGGSSNTPGTAVSKTIVLIPKQTSDPFFTDANNGAKEAAAELGYTIEFVGPNTADAAGQVTTITTEIQKHPAAITISGDDPNAVAPALKQAMAAGILVSAFNADVAKDARKFFISQASDELIAEGIVDTMAAQTNDKGHFLLVTSTATAANQNTWISQMKPYIASKHPNMIIDQILPGNDDPATVLQVVTTYLAAHKASTTGVWVIGGGMSAAVKAEQQLGIDPHAMPVAGLCIPSDVKAAIHAGTIKNCVLWSPADTAYANVYAIDAYIKGKFQADGSLPAGRLGTLTVTGGTVNVGKPVTFTVDNIDQFHF
jgi:ABC-type sugar transport system substrate-binding protein